MNSRGWSARRHPNLSNLGIVKVAAILGVMLVPNLCFSQAPPTPLPLPSIVARTFHLGIQRRSNSNLTYMLKAPDDGAPALGRILLVRKDDEPIIALRVLKDYPEKKEFAAKRVRRYADYRVLDPKEPSYIALEKISDLDGAIPETTAQDQADLKELETPPAPTDGSASPATGLNPTPGTVPPPGADPLADPAGAPTSEENQSPIPQTSEYDPELDSGTSPAPSRGEITDGSSDEENSGVSIEEVKQYDPYRHMVTAQFGLMTNYSPQSDHHLFTGGGFRYSFTPWHLLFLRKSNVQDSLSFELGMFLYKIVKMLAVEATDSIDTYTVMPVALTMRYNITFSETFSIFAYGGLMFNFVIGATAGYAEAVNLLNTFSQTALGNFRFSPIPAFGAGLLWRVGPNWAVRAEGGFDFIGAGLVLKF